MAKFFELSTGWLLRLLSFLFWANLYLYTVEKLPERSPEWCSRVVTLLHSSFGATIGFCQCGVLSYSLCPTQFTRRVTPLQYALMLWSWGYFAFDLLWCFIYWPTATLMLCHHISSLGAITISMYQSYTGCTFACTLVLLEITNPLLQIRWFLKKEGYEDTFVFLFIEVVYLTMFLILRGVLGSYIVYWVFKTNLFPVEYKLILLIFYVVSLAFLYDIMGYVLYKYKKEINIGYQQFAELCHATCLTFNEWQQLETVDSEPNISMPVRT